MTGSLWNETNTHCCWDSWSMRNEFGACVCWSPSLMSSTLWMFKCWLFWRMGTIASVLQWNCKQCGQINPTERQACQTCRTLRSSDSSSTPGSRPSSGKDAHSNTSLSRSISHSHETYAVYRETQAEKKLLKHSSSYNISTGAILVMSYLINSYLLSLSNKQEGGAVLTAPS